MRIVFMSDIHGVPSALDAALAAADALGYDRLALLGDLLYNALARAAQQQYGSPVAAAVNPNP